MSSVTTFHKGSPATPRDGRLQREESPGSGNSLKSQSSQIFHGKEEPCNYLPYVKKKKRKKKVMCTWIF